MLQRAYGNLETEKRELERSTGRLEKDKNALKKTLDKVRSVILIWSWNAVLAEPLWCSTFNNNINNSLFIYIAPIP